MNSNAGILIHLGLPGVDDRILYGARQVRREGQATGSSSKQRQGTQSWGFQELFFHPLEGDT